MCMHHAWYWWCITRSQHHICVMMMIINTITHIVVCMIHDCIMKWFIMERCQYGIISSSIIWYMHAWMYDIHIACEYVWHIKYVILTLSQWGDVWVTHNLLHTHQPPSGCMGWWCGVWECGCNIFMMWRCCESYFHEGPK